MKIFFFYFIGCYDILACGLRLFRTLATRSYEHFPDCLAKYGTRHLRVVVMGERSGGRQSDDEKAGVMQNALNNPSSLLMDTLGDRSRTRDKLLQCVYKFR
ncbi:hypothetical protein Tcan_00122 [Toxocara canis]|uniref:Uncharacterized protein n=1 Tax=Toxocara canis TaxID=6265 RepID=A0A0B2VJQ1_TOXCA|nr:hypothetical protein Tcan_00122 [Toxocara canis]